MIRNEPARRLASALLLSASGLAVAHPAAAMEVLFSTRDNLDVTVGERVTQTEGVTQIRLDSGAVLSFVDGAEYRLNADGTVELYAGSVTVAGGEGGQAVVRMPEGLEGRVEGVGSAASFSVTAEGEARGHALTGQVTLQRGNVVRTFTAGELWAANGRGAPRQVVSNGVQAAPGPDGGDGDGAVQLADLGEGGPLAAAENGLPVSLGDALAAAGASSDVIGAARRVEAAAGNPDLDAFPTGDLALLVSYAAQLEGANGGTPFPGARADIIRTYLSYLAAGNGGSTFLGAYSTVLVQYLDLLRSGALPSSFKGASRTDLEAWIAYAQRTSRFGSLSTQNKVLIDAYIAFLGTGGNPDQFTRRYTDLVNAYFAYLRTGGDAAAFAGASQQTLDTYIRFLSDSGLAGQLAAADRQLLQAYLANGGLAFTSQYRAALNAYFEYLRQGNLPSSYTALDAATLRSYLESLQATGLFSAVLGTQADFYAGWLSHLQGGGTLDSYARLNANVFAGYGTALNAYYDYLLRGGVPTAYTALTQAQIASYVAAIRSAGDAAGSRYLANLLGFYSGYSAYLAGGGNPDVYTGLPVLNLPAFADALNAYASFLAGGGLPSGYSAASLQVLRDYLDALNRSGRLNDLLGGNATLLNAYFAYLGNGGALDRYPGLPVYANYVTALQAYYAYLQGGGLPQGYTALTAAQVQAYLAALANAGGISEQLGSLGSFYTGYYAFIAAGGNPVNYSGIPAYATYASALQAYYTFLQNGGLPSAYTALTQAQVQAYLAALNAAGGFTLQLGAAADFFTDYFAFVSGGGNPVNYARLPAYASYASALTAYYNFLAGGGVPSAYTALTQAQIQQYLQALSDAGVLSANFAGATLSFFTSYLAYVVGGGVPDSFTALPNRPATLAAGANAWLFGSGGATTGTTVSAQVSADGKVEKVVFPNGSGSTTYDYTTAAYTLREYGRIGDGVAWSRYEKAPASGVTNWQDHLLVMTPATALPASGTVAYRLVGGTAPTDSYAAAGTTSYMTGSLGVAFGTTPRVGMDLSVYSGTRAWRATTAGGASDPANGGIAVDLATMRFSSSLQVTSLAGTACSAGCAANVYGGLSGTGGTQAGINYVLTDNAGTAAYIDGIAVFATSGTQLAGLGTMPSNGGSGTGGTFDPASAKINFITTLTISGGTQLTGSEIGFDATAYTLNSGGGLTSWTRTGGTTRTSGTMTVTDAAGNANAVIGRWTNGTNTGGNPFTMTANQGLHYMMTRPVAANFALPSSGTINYDFIAATKPTIIDGSIAPGTFTGDMAIVLGTAPKVAMEANIVMPGGLVRQFATTGGVADPGQSTLDLSHTAGRFAFVVPGSTANGCTPTSCVLNVWGNFAGDQNGLALMYQAVDSGGNAKAIIGAAMFGNGTLTAAPAGPSIIVGDRDNQHTITANFANFQDIYGRVTGYAATGIIESYQISNGSSWNRQNAQAPAAEAGSVAGAMGWARWTSGTTQNGTLSANQGTHIVSGTPATNLPASGTVEYSLIGSTKPTDGEGVYTPGTFAGTLGVDFATRKVGVNFDVTLGQFAWNLRTSGGSANPATGGLGLTVNNQIKDTVAITGSNAASCVTACSAMVDGFLFGPGASHFGITYGITDRQSASNMLWVSGAAAFAKP